MILKGRWRIVETELWEVDFLDMLEPAYIVFDGKTGGEFAFGCVNGQLHCREAAMGMDFTWHGNDETDEAFGDGWVELEADRFLSGQIRFHNGDDSTFIARPWPTSSTAC